MGDWRKLVEILRTLDRANDAMAAPHLAAMSDSEIVAAVKELQICSPQAAAALGRLGGARIIQPLRAILRDSDYRVGLGASNALSSIESPEALPALAELLHDQESEARAAAARSLGRMRSAGFDLLLSALQDSDPYVRRVAAGVLGKIGDPRAADNLIRTLESEKNASTQRALVAALGSLKATHAVMPMVRAALKDQSAECEVLGEVRRTLYNLDTAQIVPFLVEALCVPGSPERCNAARLLGTFGDESAVEPLIELLIDPEKKVREAGLDALASLGRRFKPAEDAVSQYVRKEEARLSQRSCPRCGKTVSSEKANPYVLGCVCTSCGWAGIWCYECKEAAMEATAEDWHRPGMSIQALLDCPQCHKHSRADEQIIAWLKRHGAL